VFCERKIAAGTDGSEIEEERRRFGGPRLFGTKGDGFATSPGRLVPIRYWHNWASSIPDFAQTRSQIALNYEDTEHSCFEDTSRGSTILTERSMKALFGVMVASLLSCTRLT
jgi:hypothetical protein